MSWKFSFPNNLPSIVLLLLLLWLLAIPYEHMFSILEHSFTQRGVLHDSYWKSKGRILSVNVKKPEEALGHPVW